MKINDVRLRGCGFTLEPAAKENNVDYVSAHKLLTIAYIKANVVNKDGLCTENGLKFDFNPELPESFTESEIAEMNVCIDDFVSEGLLESGDNGVYLFSDKMKKVLELAAQKQNKLDEEGFSFCPCHMY